MNSKRPDAPADLVCAGPEAEARALQLGGAATVDFSDSVCGLFSVPASILPDMPPETEEPPVRSLFALRGLFRL